MDRPTAVIYVLAIVVLGVLIFVPKDKENDSDTATSEPLIYSKPVFTTSVTVVCPLSLLSDTRPDHSPEKIVDMFNSILSRSEKAKSLGCEELQEGILVSPLPFEDGFVSVGLPGGTGSWWFTIASELTNKVPGQSDAERQGLTEPHTANAADARVPPTETPSSSAGHLLVNMPSNVPIPKGPGKAATDSSGSGAFICPDENRLAALADNAIDVSGNRKSTNQWEEIKQFGCSYVPPGTEMISQGPNENGSLAIVSAKLPDGTLINGLTFPNMFIKDPVQRGEMLGERSAEVTRQQQSTTDEIPQLQRSKAQENDPAEKPDAGPFTPGANDIGYPRCIYCPDPGYSEDARAAGVVGTVSLRIIVGTDGRAADVQVVKGLGHGLDELAVRAVQAWHFKPAMGPTGRPVPTTVPVEITFRLK